MRRTRPVVPSLVVICLLGVARVAAAAPFTDHFAPLEAELADIQAELEASSDPLEQKAAVLVGKARNVLASASDGLRGDARLAQKLITKLAKALGDDLTGLPPPADELAPILEAVLVALADDVVAQIDAADVVADTLPEGEKKTTKALKALDRALGTLAALAAAGGPTLDHARAIFQAASKLVKAQLKISRAGGDLARRNFIQVEVEGGELYEATQVTVRYAESTDTLEVESSSLLSSGERHVLDFTVPNVFGAGFFQPSAVSYAESETAVFSATAPGLDAECGIAQLDVGNGVVLGTFRAADLPGPGGETRTLLNGGLDFRDVEVVN